MPTPPWLDSRDLFFQDQGGKKPATCSCMSLTQTWQAVKAHYPVIATAPTSHIELKHLLPVKYNAFGSTQRVGLVLLFLNKC